MCDLGYLIRDHVPAIVQVLTNELREYNMQLRTTKCLNTAVMIMYLMLGARALQTTRTCDVQSVLQRPPEPVHIVDDLARAVSDGARSVFYVMITDGWLSRSAEDRAYFPGHVFVVETVPRVDIKRTTFNLYQSYIGQYDLSGHIASNGSLAVGKRRLSCLIRGVQAMARSRTWNKETSKFWKALTNVDESRFEGYPLGDEVRVCYRRVDSDSCITNLTKLVDRTLIQLRRLPEHELDTVFGDPKLYPDPQSALSRRDVQASFQKLQTAWA